MTADLHAVWLDDLAPGEGSTPIWDALYAEQDAETQRVVFNACADEHTEPSGIAKVEVRDWAIGLRPELVAQVIDAAEKMRDRDLPPAVAEVVDPVALPKPKKKPTPRKPAAKKSTPRKKPGVLADAEAKLAGVAARVKAQTDEMGGAS